LRGSRGISYLIKNEHIIINKEKYMSPIIKWEPFYESFNDMDNFLENFIPSQMQKGFKPV